MRFAYGATRWVILTERYAIKIARFRPIRPLVRLLQLLRKGTVRQELNKYDPNPVRGGLKYLIAGVIANLTEYRLYKSVLRKWPTCTDTFHNWWVGKCSASWRACGNKRRTPTLSMESSSGHSSC